MMELHFRNIRSMTFGSDSRFHTVAAHSTALLNHPQHSSYRSALTVLTWCRKACVEAKRPKCRRARCRVFGARDDASLCASYLSSPCLSRPPLLLLLRSVATPRAHRREVIGVQLKRSQAVTQVASCTNPCCRWTSPSLPNRPLDRQALVPLS